ncbi:translation elongation factor Ts [Candidatus Wolfebacteria bacterium CG18_big_fil_WC_8_21_14_2_50_39_7]|uniref:Elongation factor Ts n=2 Tax=Candidatus Wolfeibacteriota TaxID=1752735 RepID=A0A2H0ECY7_9BACT|nr:translation elongation factor Ts [Parcubacteria group bacterium]NCO89601.1 translation elongation factor Ts [Candidatus Wolfebacteria bacterium]OIO65770.1 MAG: translation elongation factor Ts [Candidatus Wolfebacteria bacterium CG1_02_39_135]PIP92255.1 MAG: translation elongation factor Ts [Candidatus Wolfebacteria bacterium CG18_big_fil_WC_8_21_14_2_50_39_7]NCP58361.1 translation elongation factor Ts [Candidatus Wolfebacteria bacterium]
MKEQIQKLREITGAGVMECKRALQEADGDFDKAISIIHEEGLIRAEKKKERTTGAGILESYVHNERVGVLLELRCETDFVGRSKEFKELAHNLAMQIVAMDPINIDDLLKQMYIKDETLTVEDLIKRVIAKLGENIKVERFCRYEI